MIQKQLDTFLHQGLRKKMVQEVADKLLEKGIGNKQVLEALQKVPRHFFLDSAFQKIAYQDKAFDIGSGQTISMPFTVAYQSTLLDVKPFEKILEIGTGSTYQACVLAQLGAQVFTIERQQALFQKNRMHFPLANIVPYKSIKFFYGDGFLGLPTYAPFHKIIITAAAPVVPPALLQQLKIGGKMVIPVDDAQGEKQIMKRITKIDANNYSEEIFDIFSFVPMLQGTKSASKK